MSAQITTREFQIADYDAAVRLWSGAEGVEIAEGDSREDITRYLSHNPGLSRVAEENGNIVGVVLCGHDGRRGLIYHLTVDPAFQHRGIARRLVSECLDRLRRLQLRRALILVSATNESGLAFWRRCGWEDVPGPMLMGIDL
jgi:N-acetylglutamate synthase